jgi:hypothetical protein
MYRTVTVHTISSPNTEEQSGAGTRRGRGSVCLGLAIAGWATAIGACWWKLAAYEFRLDAGPTAAVLAHWPSDTNLSRSAGRPAVLFFMHPKCPCTRASIAELERLLVLDQRGRHSPQLTVVVTVPANAAEDWLTTETVERARALANASIVIDRGGAEARRFGVATSGSVMWFDVKGRRLYAGGITASRGHEGDNAGRDALVGLLRGSREPAFGVPALGCRLCLPSSNNTAATSIGTEVSPHTSHDG